jgi:polyprenyl-phospho-N-acetylgalactosaminyl synthase
MAVKIYIVIAAYNEGRNISKVLKDLKAAGYRNIIVVDDGSKDSTQEYAEKEGATVLRHIINRGQGASLRTGIDYALDQGADIVVTFDADGQHKTGDLKAMIDPVRNGEYDITLGSRFLKRSSIPFFRRITLKIAILVLWIFYGIRMTDAHNGFRAMSRKAAQQISITSDRMEHASQIVEEIHKKKIKYKEIPVTITYNEYTLKHGHGSFLQALKVFLSMVLRRLVK